MLQFTRSSIAVLGLVLLSFSGMATHLVGGSITWEHLSATATTATYRITFKTYLDCTSPNWGNAFPEPSLQIGFYEGTASQTGTLFLSDSLTLPLVDSMSINPELPPGCSIGLNVCFYEITYQNTITLPHSFDGYHVFYDRCCRNSGTVNLDQPGTQGMGFTAWIGPTLLSNSSPVFTNPPAPYLCVGDTQAILNTAFDAEGDLLVFSFTDPYRGNTGNGAAGNPPPDLGVQNPITLPIPQVTWNGSGYGTNSIFGSNGYQYVNSFTGYSEYMSPLSGPHVVAVQINEYRFGNLIGITRRDIQIIVDACQPNDPPELVSFTSDEPLITIEEGDSICFPITYFDANGDSVDITINGPIFDSNITNPPATLTPALQGSNTVTTDFCWATECGQAQDIDYLFTVSVPDDGCPPKVENTVFRIHVNEFLGPSSIAGQTTVCSGLTNTTYTTDTIAGATYHWSVTGGTIIGSDSDVTVTVDWGNGPVGQMAVSATSQNGCTSNTITETIVFNTIFAEAGPDQSICFGDSVVIGGSPTSFPGFDVEWTPSASLSSSTDYNPIAFPDSTTTYFVTVTDNASGCFSVDSVTVTVPDLPMEASPDGGVCIGDSIGLSATGAQTYAWSPAASLTDSSIANPIAFPAVPTTYVVTMTDAVGCVKEDSVFVDAWVILPVDAGLDTTFCDGASVVLGGNPTTPAFASFDWSPATALDDTAASNPVATPTPGTYTYTVLATDTNGCFNSDTVVVTVNANPTANAGNDVSFCFGDTTQLSASGGLSYNWDPTDSLSNGSAADPFAWPGSTTTYTVTVTDGNNCTATDDVTLTVFALPTADAGNDVGICFGDSTQLVATGGNLFSWAPATNIDNAAISSPNVWPSSTTTYSVTVTDANNCTAADSVEVAVNPLPVADAGPDTLICLGDTVTIGGSPTGPIGATYLWTTIGNIAGTTASNPLAFPSATADYTVEVTDSNACTAVDTMTVTVNPIPTANAGLDTAICLGDTLQLNGSGTGTPMWNNGTWLSAVATYTPLAFPDDTINFVLTVTDANGCEGKDTMQVIVYPLPNPIAAPVVDVCIGDTIQLSASGAVSYLWTPNTNLSDDTIANPLAWPSDTTLYVVAVTDTNMCSNSDSVTVVVNPLPIVSAGSNAAICFGDSIQIGGTPTGPALSVYEWSPNSAISDSTLSNPLVWPAATQTYTVAVTDSNTCVNSDSVVIMVNPLPTVSAGPDLFMCSVDSVQLNASGALTYQWSPATGLSNATVASPMASPADTTSYVVVGTDANSCINSDTAIVHVWALPTANAGPDAWLCPGDETTLNATGGITYNWAPAFGLSDSTISNPVVTLSDTNQYVLTVTDINGCLDTDTLNVIVNGIVPTDAGTMQTMCFGDSVQIGGAPSAPDSSLFFWTPASSLSDSASGNPMASPAFSEWYYLAVTNDTCVGLDSVQVVVNQLPPANAGADDAICIGDSLQLNATGGVSYAWSPGANLSDSTVASPIANATDTTDFVVTVTDINGCVDSDTMTLTVNPLPIVDAGPDVAICFGDSASIGGAPTGPALATYQWSPGTSLDSTTASNPTAFPLADEAYVVMVTDSNGCMQSDAVTVFVNALPLVSAGSDLAICIFDSISLNATGALTFVWAPANGLSDSLVASPMASPDTSTQYVVVGTDANGCFASDTVLLVVNLLPNVSAGLDVEICIGDSTQLGASGASTYAWTPSLPLLNPFTATPIAFPSTTTNFVVVGTDANSCENSDTVVVVVNPLPNVDAGTDTISCSNDPVVLGGNPTGPALSTFAWSPAANLDDATAANPVATPAATTTFYVVVTDSNGCVNTDSTLASIFSLDSIPDSGICEDDEVAISVATVSGVGPYTYSWTPGAGLSAANIPNPVASPSATTTYTVQVTDGNGCVESEITEVSVFPRPDAAFQMALVPTCEGIEITFENLTDQADSYEWRYMTAEGTMETDSAYEITRSYQYGESVDIELYAIDNTCADSTSAVDALKTLESYFDFTIPNVFTPNSDNVNDVFKGPFSDELAGCTNLQIFNRWGLQVYPQGDAQVSEWDGNKHNGQPAPEGTYFYVYTIGDLPPIKGTVMLFRARGN